MSSASAFLAATNNAQAEVKAKPKSKNIDLWVAQAMWSVINTPIEVHYGASGLSYAALRRLARTPQVAAILRTRGNQVAEWAKRQPDPFSTGWKIRIDDYVKKETEKDRTDIAYCEALVEGGGGPWFLGGQESFFKAITRDSLMYDKVTFEIVKDPVTGLPIAMVPVDPETIRRVEPPDEDKSDERWDYNGVAYSQWIDGQEKATFTNMELAWGARNPRTELGVIGHGHPEMEELIYIVSNIINSMASNAANYLTGVNGNTMVVFKTRMGKERFQAVERLVHSALMGPRQNRKTPFIQIDPTLGEDIGTVSLGVPSNADMQYADWINFLLRTICAVFCIDPAEMGFIFGNEGVKNQQYANSPLDRIINSKERGLRPLLRSIAQWINYWVIKPYWPRLKFEFVGFDAQTAKDKDDANAKKVMLWKTPNQIRVEEGDPPLDHPAADLPLHANFTLDNSLEPPPVAEYDSAGAWLNGRRVRRPAFSEAA